MQGIHSITLDELTVELETLGQPAYRAGQVMEWLYDKRVDKWEDMTSLPAGLRRDLAGRYDFPRVETVRVLGSEDTTRKFLFRLGDGNLVESVLIPASPALYAERSDRRTLCVSSQVGCAYGCKFCASGLGGFSRNLDAGEIVAQILKVEAAAKERVDNLVFMGMGEPLANLANVLRAITILNAPWGVGIGARHITVSTSGLVPQIRELADQPLQIRLAVSLHGPNDAVRGQIMPVNRKYPVAELIEACRYYRARKKQKITFEYILIEGINDGLDAAKELAGLSRELGAKVNLIPYNAVEGLEWKRPSVTRQRAFHAVLEAAGVQSTIRLEKGHDIDAACGQLRLQTLRDNSFAAPAPMG